MTVLPDNVCPLQGRLRFGESGPWIFDRLAAAIEPLPLPPERHLRLRERVVARFAARPRTSVTVKAADGEWQPLAPGVSVKLLRIDTAADNMTAYVRMQPGASLESHAHGQTEECLLLEGEIFIGRYRLGAGDMHVAEAGTVHENIVSPRGALMLVRAQTCAPARPDHPAGTFPTI